MNPRYYDKCCSLMRRNKKEEVLALIQKAPWLKSALGGDVSLISEAVILKRSLGLSFVRRLLEIGVDPNVVNSTGSTPLINASANGDCALVRLLLSHGSEVNHRTFLGETAFSFACANNRLSCAKILVDNGADINIPIGDPPMSRPLDWAERYASKKFVSWLRAIGGRKAGE